MLSAAAGKDRAFASHTSCRRLTQLVSVTGLVLHHKERLELAIVVLRPIARTMRYSGPLTCIALKQLALEPVPARACQARGCGTAVT